MLVNTIYEEVKRVNKISAGKDKGYGLLPGRTGRLMDIFAALKKYLEKEQKEIFFHKKSRQEENDYFNFMKFLFSSPDKNVYNK